MPNECEGFLDHDVAWDTAIVVNQANDAMTHALDLTIDGPSSNIDDFVAKQNAWEEVARAHARVGMLDTISGEEAEAARQKAIEAAINTAEWRLIRDYGQMDLSYLERRLFELSVNLEDKEALNILYSRFGIGVEKPQTRNEIGEALGIATSIIGKRELNALHRLKNAAWESLILDSSKSQ